jgi:hypothetical protein
MLITMVLFDNLFDEEHVRYKFVPELTTFYVTPSLANAEKVLDALQLHVPLRALLSVHFAQQQINKQNKKKRKAKTPIRTLVKRVKRGGAPNVTDCDALIALQHIDVLHDIHYGFKIPEQVIDVVMDGVPLTPAEKQPFLNACRKLNNPTTSLTGEIDKRMSRLFGLPRSNSKMSRLSVDKELYGMVSGWMRQQSIELVIDGIFEPPNRNGVQNTSVARGLCLCAFFTVLVGKYSAFVSHVPGPMPSGVLDIDLLTGTFHTMDMGNSCRFASRWVKYFNHMSGSFTMKHTDIQQAEQPYDQTIRIFPSHVVIDGVNVPIENPNVTLQQIPMVSPDSFAMMSHQHNVHVHYTKPYLQGVFAAYASLLPNERIAFAPFMKQLIRINACRDAYKADVALQRGAIYMTVDRIAHLYYLLRCRIENATDQGVYFCVKGTNDMDMVVGKGDSSSK